MCRKVLRVFAAIAAVAAVGMVAAAPAAEGRTPPKKMKMQEPMASGMMKKGMTKGDVKAAAEKKARAMQPMMEQEEKAMAPAKAKP